MTAQQRIAPHLWYASEAREAAEFYVSVFPGSRITGLTTIPGTPSGDCDIVSFEVLGHPFQAISAGPLFQPNPSISFIVSRPSAAEVEALWQKLAEGGQVLMPLDAYPFSERYGWVQDRYGVSWQLIVPQAPASIRQAVMPSLMFNGDNCGKAEEAIAFYTSVFENSQAGQVFRYGADQEPDREGTVMFADFELDGQLFAAMDSARAEGFAFNEAISLVVRCQTQREIDSYWERLSAVPEAERCGWLKDRYGVSWQVVPAALDEMMRRADAQQLERLTQALMPMKKIDAGELQRAYDGG